MSLSEKQLSEIDERNKTRKELKRKTTAGEWLYDSFAFIDAGAERLPRSKQMCIIVRPRTWLDAAWEKCGDGFLDQWINPKNMQPYHDANWIVEAHNDQVEKDIDALLAEIKRLGSG